MTIDLLRLAVLPFEKDSANNKRGKMQGTLLAAIIMATRLEARPLIELFNLREIESRPFPIYSGKGLVLAVSGIGKANAAMVTAYICVKFYPEWVLNLGAAGATQESTEIGSIFHIQKTIEPDRLNFHSKRPYVQIPEMLPGFQDAVLATLDKAVTELGTFEELAAVADLVDMEGASVLQTCRRLGRRCLLFKFVSDTPVCVGRSEIIIENITHYGGTFCDFIFNRVLPMLRDV
jgi:adenosylhomocysteine nucleosidase